MEAASLNATLEAHLAAFFHGHQRDSCGPMAARSPAFHVMRFAPGPRTGLWVYCSVGAWESAKPGGSLLESFMVCNRPAERIVELLTMVAHYHGDHALGRGHSLGIGEPWLENSRCDCILVSTPYTFGPDLEVCNLPDSHVHYLWALPITAAERQLKVTAGLDALEDRFESARVKYWDPGRESVV